MSLNEAVIKSNIIPEEFIFMAEHCQLCFLSTVRDNIPDIHIMFFSYYKDENVIILSSEKNTQKLLEKTWLLFRGGDQVISILAFDEPNSNPVEIYIFCC